MTDSDLSIMPNPEKSPAKLRSNVKVFLEEVPGRDPRCWVRIIRSGSKDVEEIRYQDLVGKPAVIEEDRAVKQEASRQFRALMKEWKAKNAAKTAPVFEIVRVVSDRSPYAKGFDVMKHFTIYYKLDGIEHQNSSSSLDRIVRASPEKFPKDTMAMIRKAVGEKLASLRAQCKPPEPLAGVPEAEQAHVIEPPAKDVPTATLEAVPSIIPERLHPFRFVLVKKRDKGPIEAGWNIDANHSYNDPELAKHLEAGGNYGVLCGERSGYLAVVDADYPEVAVAVDERLPPTFTVKSGREGAGGFHYYYVVKDLDAPIRLMANDGKIGSAGDVKFTGGQVIGPGSIHPSGNRYTVIDDRPIAELSAELLRAALQDFLPLPEMDTQDDLKRQAPEGGDDLDQLRIEKVIPLDGLTRHGHKYQGSCPWHGSDTGSNFTIDLDKNVWHCFRHGTGGGPMAAIAVQEGIIDCGGSVRGGLTGQRFKDALRVAQEKHGLVLTPRPEKSKEKGKNGNNGAADLMMAEIAKSDIEVFTDQFKMPFAAIERNGHREIHPISIDSDLGLWLTYLFYKRTDGRAPPREALDQVIRTLTARARFEGEVHELSLRMAWYGGDLWYDLGGEDWKAVRISPSIKPHGWEIVDRPPIMFKRNAQTVPQVLPEAGGEWGELWDVVNLPMDDYGALCRSHIVQMFIPGHPRPFLDLYNRRGGGKTFTAMTLRALVDPTTTPLAVLENLDRNFNNIMDQNYLPVFDNLKTIADNLEGKFCRCVTGETAQERRLGTNRQQEVYQYQRTGILTSVYQLGLDKPEVAARLIYLEAPFISNARREEELNAEFFTARPKILGFIFSTIARAMAELPTVEIYKLPRMADYTTWGEAISRALGEGEEIFLKQYEENVSQTISATMDANPLAQAILEYFGDGKKEYVGTADPFYQDLVLKAAERNIDIKSKEAANSWPGAPNALTRKMPDIIDDLKRFKLHYAKTTFGKLSDKAKGKMAETKLAPSRSIIMLVKEDSDIFSELPAERCKSDSQRYSKNIVRGEPDITKQGVKNDKTILSAGPKAEGD